MGALQFSNYKVTRLVGEPALFVIEKLRNGDQGVYYQNGERYCGCSLLARPSIVALIANALASYPRTSRPNHGWAV